MKNRGSGPCLQFVLTLGEVMVLPAEAWQLQHACVPRVWLQGAPQAAQAHSPCFPWEQCSDHTPAWQGLEESQMWCVFAQNDHTNPHPEWGMGSGIERSWNFQESAVWWLSLQETSRELNKTGSGGAGSNFSCFYHSIYKLQYFWYLSAKLHVSFTSLKTSLKKFLADGSSFHVASSPAPKATPALQIDTFFSGLFSCCSDAYHCPWVVSQLPGQSLMNVIPWHCALHPTARCLPAGLL